MGTNGKSFLSEVQGNGINKYYENRQCLWSIIVGFQSSVEMGSSKGSKKGNRRLLVCDHQEGPQGEKRNGNCSKEKLPCCANILLKDV
jgi:hypothetical protein